MIELLATPVGRKAVLTGGVLLFLVGSHTWVYFEGRTARDNQVKLENAKLEKQVADAYRVQVEYGNLKAAEVENQRQESADKLTEVLSNVHKVTTKRPCLSAAAVSLLNGTSKGFGLSASPSHAATEDAAGVASDTDVAQWIAKTKEQYERCAANNNGIIDILNQTKN